MKEYLQLPRLILTADLYPNPDQKGKDAEYKLYEMTIQLYPDLKHFQSNNSEYFKYCGMAVNVANLLNSI